MTGSFFANTVLIQTRLASAGRNVTWLTSGATSTFAAYNLITAPKILAVEFEQAHTYPPEQSAAINDWVVKFLGLK